MKTTWSIGSRRRKWSAWSSISEAVRLRRNRIWPVAQNVQVSGQPLCEETQTERLPSRNRIRTASNGRPSPVWNKVLTVPSRDRASCAASSVEIGSLSASRARSGGGTSVISS